MFRFKQFAVRQEQCPMKVGTDGVLLGAWARVGDDDRRILDIGTGTGLIALMMAQRAPEAAIEGVDIADVAEARANADASPWAARLSFHRMPVQQFRPADGRPYDLILANPPYFVDSLTCPDEGRTRVRHAVALPFDELRDAVVRLLAPGGRFALILPLEEAHAFDELCRGLLVPVRRTGVRTTPRRPLRRLLTEYRHVEAGELPSEPECDELVIGTGEHECYTESYRALTRDFYLKF
ncbi:MULTISPECIES: methyltransferase [unclassified Alistipes]|uniref:tRNA1(Val) (adenine(37)-N6)-methyltransferase n=1 Tax=unclassified Alistipes TaxID=2608932 RepID=UPI000B3AB6F3|nr:MULTISPECIES: methyltransferase [unclassified Alistipes]OUO19439.1 methyltransferase [Alistipes sp. An31A]